METVVVRITEPRQKGGGYPIELLTGASCDPAALVAVPNATDVIPATLKPAAPVTLPGQKALKAADVAERYDGAETSDDYLAIGEFLYRLVARGTLATEWAAIRTAAAANGTPLRTLLEIAPGPAMQPLHALPWELLYDPDQGLHLFLERDRPFARGVPATSAAGARQPPALDDWPLRVLVVLGAEPEADGSGGAALGGGALGGGALGGGALGIGARRELEALERLFAASRFDVEYQLLEHPLPERIVAACEHIRPHVLHFIGHGEGGANPRAHALQIFRPARQGALEEYRAWPLLDIRTALRGFAPRFAFLNACRTGDAAAARNAFVPVTSLSDAFLQLPGTLGVLGMQGDIPGDVAAEFSRAFYAAVIAGEPVDQATLTARLAAMSVRGDIAQRREWSMPMLRTTVCPELVLPHRPAGACASPLVERFVARVPQRRLVRETTGAAAGSAAGRSPHLVLIVGDEDVGKSHLAKWSAQICEWRGNHGVYVSFGNAAVDVLGALRWIRDGRRPEAGKRPTRVDGWGLPAEAFRRFNWELNQRKRGLTKIPPLPDTGDVEDEGTPLAEGADPPETLVEDTLRQFCLALEAAAADRPLVLILDQLEGLEQTTLTQWLPRWLFKPIAAGQVKNVRLVLVLRRTEMERKLDVLRQMQPPPTIVSVELFDAEEIDSAVRSLSLQWSEQASQVITRAYPVLRNMYGRPNGWGGKVLQAVDQLCAALPV